MIRRSCSFRRRSRLAFRRASRPHAVLCTPRRMRPCLFRIGVWSCGLLTCGHRLVVLRAGVGPAWVECVVVIMVVCGMVPWLVGVRPLVSCCSACSDR
nr:MAG TPA: hypothetical protein [Caudoviricetes sp.]